MRKNLTGICPRCGATMSRSPKHLRCLACLREKRRAGRAKGPPTVEEAAALFIYDPIKGLVLSRATGQEAGYLHASGYRKITVNAVTYPAHRIAWLLAHGEWPKNLLDHINGNRADNRIENLREATEAQNHANRRVVRAVPTKSKYKGVTASLKNWRAVVKSQGRYYHLGTFRTEEEAARAYDAAAVRLSGEYACVNFPDEIGGNRSNRNPSISVSSFHGQQRSHGGVPRVEQSGSRAEQDVRRSG